MYRGGARIVVTDQALRPEHDIDFDKAAQRNHLSFCAADIDAINIVDRGAVFALRLHLHLPGATEQIHIIDIKSTERCL